MCLDKNWMLMDRREDGGLGGGGSGGEGSKFSLFCGRNK